MNQEVRTDPKPAKRISSTPTTVLLARRLHADPEHVFDAWLDPAKAKKWITAPSRADAVVSVSIDARIGGSFSFVLDRDGQEIEHLGGYVEIDRPRRLAFTWNVSAAREHSGVRKPETGSLVTLDFAPAGTGTELRLTHEGVPEEYALATEEGWSKVVQALANSIPT
jgi:uncharacterized protein YndB with AHSA1/START domain